MFAKTFLCVFRANFSFRYVKHFKGIFIHLNMPLLFIAMFSIETNYLRMSYIHLNVSLALNKMTYYIRK